ncbi:MAG: SIS domain-containing protein, partial [Anaerolineae bacterium]
AVLDQFRVDVIYLDGDVYQGEELLARISRWEKNVRDRPNITVTRYDGTPVAVAPQSIRLNPAMVGKRGYDTYTESHIAEIPDVMDAIVQAYVQDGQLNLGSIWEEDELMWPGLNCIVLRSHFGTHLEQLNRLLLIGEGSSWRDAQAAAPLFRELFPNVVVNVYRPIQVLNLGEAIDPAHDLALEISWSGTTDSLLKVDRWLAQMGVKRVAITGRTQSDLGRRAARSGGVLNVHTGVEVSVATVKGYEAILMTLHLLALQLAEMHVQVRETIYAPLLNELLYVVPQHVRAAINDAARSRFIRQIADRCRDFNKVAVVGDSPVDIEAELKVEELAQIVARTSDFHDADLRALIERSALVKDDRQRTLFIINATTPGARWEAQFIINYLRELGVFCLIHTTPHDRLADWQKLANTAVFVSPQVSDALQPLVDAHFTTWICKLSMTAV